MKRVSKERIRALIRAATNSKNLKKLHMANTAISDQEARVSSLILEKNWRKIFKNLFDHLWKNGLAQT